MTIERRMMPGVALRMDDAAESRTVRGHAAVYNEMSEDFGGWRERIAPGAFGDLAGADIRALWDHDTGHVLGRTRSGTLRLSEDDRGLAVEIDMPDHASAVMEAMRRGDVDQMSFGFYTRKDAWEKIDGQAVRTLVDVELIEVSIVAIPAYPQTDAALRDRARALLAPAPRRAPGIMARRLRLIELDTPRR
jgi:HK97 family phage prohead protease